MKYKVLITPGLGNYWVSCLGSYTPSKRCVANCLMYVETLHMVQRICMIVKVLLVEYHRNVRAA